MTTPFQAEKRLLAQYSAGVADRDSCDLLYQRIKIEIKKFKTEEVPNEIVHTKHLLLNSQGQDEPNSLLDVLRIVNLILNTRGLTRWVSLNLLSKEIRQFEYAHSFSRLEILRLWFQHFPYVFGILRNHFSLSLDKINEKVLPLMGQNQYIRAFSVGKIDLPELCILSTGENFQLKLKNGLNTSNLAISLIERDSISLMNLFLEYGSEPEILEFLNDYFPDGLDYIKSRQVITVVELDGFNKSFDQRNVMGFAHRKADILENVEIWHQRFILRDNHLLQFDSTSSHQLPFVAGHWQYLTASKFEKNKIFLTAPTLELKDIPEAIFLSNRADENWYHFLLDTLPRFLFMKDVPLSVPVLIRDDLPLTTKDFLRKIIRNPIIEIPSESTIKVSKLHLLAARSTCFDSINDSVVNRVEFSPEIIREISQWIKDELSLQGLPGSTYSFIARNSRQRRALNARKIQKISTDFGFQVVPDNSDLYKNQSYIFATLGTGVTFGGAVLANMIFMNQGSKILCLRSTRQNDLELWKKLAEAVGVEYEEVTGFPLYYGSNELRRDHSNYYLSPRKYRKSLRSLKASITN
jgi:hypothetical protein